EAGKLHAGIAGECVPEEAVFPAGEGVDDENADALRASGDGEFARVVRGDEFSIGDGDGEFERGGAFFVEPPEDGVVGFGIGWQDDVFRALAPGFVTETDDGADLPGE